MCRNINKFSELGWPATKGSLSFVIRTVRDVVERANCIEFDFDVIFVGFGFHIAPFKEQPHL